MGQVRSRKISDVHLRGRKFEEPSVVRGTSAIYANR